MANIQLNTLKECLQFLEWLRQDANMRAQVATVLHGRIKNYYKGKNTEHDIKQSLNHFLNNVSAFYTRLCYNPDAGKYRNQNPNDIVNTLLECLPKFLAAMYYLWYCVNPTFDKLGGGGWKHDWPGGSASWAGDYGGDLDKYLQAQSNETKYGGMMPGGFAYGDIKYNKASGYYQGYNMAVGLENILNKYRNMHNFFSDIFVTSTLSTAGIHKVNAGNAVALVGTFCGIVKQKDESFRNNVESPGKPICWQDLIKHCAHLQRQFGRMFTKKRFDHTGQSPESRKLNEAIFAKETANWFRINLDNVKRTLEGIKPYYGDLGGYFTHNLFPYGFTFFSDHRYTAQSKDVETLKNDWNTVIGELKKEGDGLAKLKKILEGEYRVSCPVRPPPEPAVPSAKLPNSPKQVIPENKSSPPTETKSTTTKAKSPQGKKANGAPNQGTTGNGQQNPKSSNNASQNQNRGQSGGKPPTSSTTTTSPSPPIGSAGAPGPAGPQGGRGNKGPDSTTSTTSTLKNTVSPQQPSSPQPVHPSPASPTGHPAGTGSPGQSGGGSGSSNGGGAPGQKAAASPAPKPQTPSDTSSRPQSSVVPAPGGVPSTGSGHGLPGAVQPGGNGRGNDTQGGGLKTQQPATSPQNLTTQLSSVQPERSGTPGASAPGAGNGGVPGSSGGTGPSSSTTQQNGRGTPQAPTTATTTTTTGSGAGSGGGGGVGGAVSSPGTAGKDQGAGNSQIQKKCPEGKSLMSLWPDGPEYCVPKYDFNDPKTTDPVWDKVNEKLRDEDIQKTVERNIQKQNSQMPHPPRRQTRPDNPNAVLPAHSNSRHPGPQHHPIDPLRSGDVQVDAIDVPTPVLGGNIIKPKSQQFPPYDLDALTGITVSVAPDLKLQSFNDIQNMNASHNKMSTIRDRLYSRSHMRVGNVDISRPSPPISVEITKAVSVDKDDIKKPLMAGGYPLAALDVQGEVLHGFDDSLAFELSGEEIPEESDHILQKEISAQAQWQEMQKSDMLTGIQRDITQSAKRLDEGAVFVSGDKIEFPQPADMVGRVVKNNANSELKRMQEAQKYIRSNDFAVTGDIIPIPNIPPKPLPLLPAIGIPAGKPLKEAKQISPLPPLPYPLSVPAIASEPEGIDLTKQKRTTERTPVILPEVIPPLTGQLDVLPMENSTDFFGTPIVQTPSHIPTVYIPQDSAFETFVPSEPTGDPIADPKTKPPRKSLTPVEIEAHPGVMIDEPICQLYSPELVTKKVPSTDHSIPPPRTLREMLCWISDLPHALGYADLINHLANSFEGSESIDVSPESISSEDVTEALSETCGHASSVLAGIQEPVPIDLNKLHYERYGAPLMYYSEDPYTLLCQLLSYVYATYHQLSFLRTQCRRESHQGGWRDCQYGKNVKASYSRQCTEDPLDPMKLQGHGCNPSPLQGFLTDQSDLSTYWYQRNDVCRRSRIKMGFVAKNFRNDSKHGFYIYNFLTGACYQNHDPLEKLCRYLVCLTKRTPRTTGELVSFFHHFGNSLHDVYSNELLSLGSSLTRSHADCPDWDHLKNSDLQAVKGIRGSESLNVISKNNHNHNHDKEHPRTLSMLLGCSDDHKNCPPHCSPITYRAYALYSHAFAHTYLSWTVYLPDRLLESLEKLHYELKKHVSIKCSSLHSCPDVLPLLYTHGFTPPEVGSQVSLTCSDVICELKDVITGKPIASLMTAMDDFLYNIREPFIFTLVALWSTALLIFANTMLYRLDVLHIRSHLIRTKASHHIDVKALLTKGRKMLSLYKDVDYFDEDPIGQLVI
ncbi:hypothetical protein BBBOND_0310280 [Babesia bigemina]|uniref:Ribosome binding protein n=1 Tax=Babesia bigemina TaxID=5866 RepID=A0A061DEE2_BABBI|nr:hypothetical protein BBBOND_0310280 [Babesia bigemina]CDR97125.1 hypothetical protein BBBOND_0310280 [Babesia bigemina]|eukprot:XP_012769311.1 hypothetical protein BBBOND_0310280 [Babesia bigemina]